MCSPPSLLIEARRVPVRVVLFAAVKKPMFVTALYEPEPPPMDIHESALCEETRKAIIGSSELV
jgi:hypothetical protein